MVPVGLITTLVLLVGCTTTPPSNVDNICAIFREKDDWYAEAKESRARWGIPVTVMMAIMHQESRFVATAKPPRKKIFGFIPGPRPSDSYGYSQALESTWTLYQRSSGNYGADRDDFSDAIDFIGWYGDQSHRINSIARDDAYRLYLAYHEGHGGFKRRTYESKDWLIAVARKVERRANSYNTQLRECAPSLEDEGWFNWF
ncbi:transcriptional regulatory protein [Luminiphilus syltensis NOR5-1B]|uniref:Transcriptional regulatory protein n=2 Tax=Luminiphilus TaxID=1341118 RepID=B8KRT8_9GAMM|nr:transcriptional regulatory protein [Luminiphilus syltensis NOR5-1B]